MPTIVVHPLCVSLPLSRRKDVLPSVAPVHVWTFPSCLEQSSKYELGPVVVLPRCATMLGIEIHPRCCGGCCCVSLPVSDVDFVVVVVSRVVSGDGL